MTKVNDGGPAFPTSQQISQNRTTGETVVYQYLSDGVSIRDYFAAKAMQGFCAGAESGDDIDRLPSLAYAMADAMLEERAK
jgi:hypothetical protein